MRDDEMRELLAKWRGRIGCCHNSDYLAGRSEMLTECADELEDLLTRTEAGADGGWILARGFFHRDEQDEDGDYEFFGSHDPRCEKCIPCLIVDARISPRGAGDDAEGGRS